MTPKITWSVLAVGLLVACPAPDDPGSPTTVPTSTPPTPTPPVPSPTAPTPFSAEADVTDPAVLVGLASASAPRLFASHYGLLAEADDASAQGCPTVTEATLSTTYTGGCVDSNGVDWVGSAVVTQGEATVTVTFAGFGSTSGVPCTTTGEVENDRSLDGTLVLAPDLSTVTYATHGTFTTIDPDACTGETRSFQLDYAGVTPAAVGVWAGAGTYADDRYGRVAVETVDAVLDEARCATEALTGVTTFVTSTDVAVILYDGAVDCDPESTAIWLLNGASEGEIAGVGCASTPARGAGVLGLAALIAARRRRGSERPGGGRPSDDRCARVM